MIYEMKLSAQFKVSDSIFIDFP